MRLVDQGECHRAFAHRCSEQRQARRTSYGSESEQAWSGQPTINRTHADSAFASITDPGISAFSTTIPRLLNVVVPGFDLYLQDHLPDFHRPATLLLTMSVRIPVLAGVFMVATQPSYWAERLLSSADRRDWKRLVACFRTLTTPALQISRKPELGLVCDAENWGSSEQDFSLIAA